MRLFIQDWVEHADVGSGICSGCEQDFCWTLLHSGVTLTKEIWATKIVVGGQPHLDPRLGGHGALPPPHTHQIGILRFVLVFIKFPLSHSNFFRKFLLEHLVLR